MAVRGHRKQIDGSTVRDLDELRGWIAHRQLCFHRTASRRQLGFHLFEIGAILFHLLRFPQLQLIEIARGPAVGDVDEKKRGARHLGELRDVIDDRPVRARVLDRHQNPAVHQTFQPRSA